METPSLVNALYLAPPIMWRFYLGKPLRLFELRELQNRKLRALIGHSYENVPYYHSLMKKADLRPDDIKTIDDLHKMPVTTKKDIIGQPPQNMTASDYDLDKCVVQRTSGTTGIPLTVYKDKRAQLVELLLKIRYQLECGDRLANRQILIGTTTLSEDHPLQKIGIWKAKRISQLNDVGAQIKQIKEFDPRTIQATTSCVDELANEIIEKDAQGIDIRLVFAAGEHVDDHTRELGKQAFNAEVFDLYGSIEVGRIYNECVEHSGYHVAGESVIVEITRNGETVSTGDDGEITVTNLNNYAMPFIRYNQEDIGALVAGDCLCGSCLPLMRLTEGRKKDRIMLPDGRVISATVLIHEMRYVEGIRQFQIIQEGLDDFTVRIVKQREFSDQVPEEIRRRVKQTLGDVDISVEAVDIILKEKTGKTKQFITKIPVASQIIRSEKRGRLMPEISSRYR